MNPLQRLPILARPSNKAEPTRRRKVVTRTVVVLVLAAIGYGGWAIVSHLSADAASCKTGEVTDIAKVNGECIGVTDGEYPFDPSNQALAGVEAKIQGEDTWVRQQGPHYVSSVFLLPLSTTGGVETIQNATEQLEGAYAAVHYANRYNVEATRPLVQLLIGSSGTDAAEYQQADSIIEDHQGTWNIVAVAGISVSLATTQKEVMDLTDDGIPVFGSTITSNSFNNINNLVRVSPSNSQEVQAALQFIKPGHSTAILVEDTNPNDTYDQTLLSGFLGFADKTHKIVRTEAYDTYGEKSQQDAVGLQVANRIGLMLSDICSYDPSVVLFAGRGRELAQLIGDFAGQECAKGPVTILTGDSVTNMSIDGAVKQALGNAVTLEYVGEAAPDEWDASLFSAPGKPMSPIVSWVVGQGTTGFNRFVAEFTSKQDFPGVSYNDGNAMMGYDAVLTEIRAIRLTGMNATPAGVAENLNAVSGSHKVCGASGPISLSAIYGQGGDGQGSNPVDKVIPILQLNPNGQVSTVKTVIPADTPITRDKCR